MQQSVASHYQHSGYPNGAAGAQIVAPAGQEVVYDTTCYQQDNPGRQQQPQQPNQPYQKCEVSVASARASVLVYNEQSKKWVPSGTSSGLSKVHIYQHTLNGTFRIVGRKLDDHEVVINSAILRGFKYNQATATFHQWRDQRTIYGLNFSQRDDAEQFALAMTTALEQLANPSAQPPLTASIPSGGPAPPIYQAPVELPPQNNQPPAAQHPATNGAGPPPPPPPMPQHPVHQRNSSNGPPQQNPYGSLPLQTSVVAPPAPPPPAPPVPPAAPPVPITGAPPPPPPPPPPPGVGGADQGNSLAAALASVKLKKTSPPHDSNTQHAPENHVRKQSSGNPMASMLDEMQGTLAKRRAQAEKKSAATALFQEPATDPLASNGTNCKTWSPGQNGVGGAKKNDGELSPKSQRNRQRMGSVGDVDGIKMNGDSNGSSVDNEQLERLKNEIVQEMRKQMNKMKEEIITALRQELNRR